jgi:hypothetical protein
MSGKGIAPTTGITTANVIDIATSMVKMEFAARPKAIPKARPKWLGINRFAYSNTIIRTSQDRIS